MGDIPSITPPGGSFHPRSILSVRFNGSPAARGENMFPVAPAVDLVAPVVNAAFGTYGRCWEGRLCVGAQHECSWWDTAASFSLSWPASQVEEIG